jgi:hypothetical protein
MSDRVPPLDRQAADFLLSVTETPEASVSAIILDEFYAAVAPALKANGLLQPKDHQRATVSLTDHEDEPVNLTWSPDHRGYGYFSPTAGWVAVPSERLAVFRVGFDELFDRLLERLDLPPGSQRAMLVPDLLWEVGEVRLPGRGKRVPIWIGRRLADPTVWRRFGDTVRARPAPGLRIVLSLTAADRLPAHVFHGHSLVSVRDVADHTGLAVDPELLAARIASGLQGEDVLISMAADGAAVTVHGKRYTFSGSKQRAVIRQLFEAWQTGHPERLTAEVLETAGYSDSVNTLAKAFSKRSDWRDFIEEQHGCCRFSL